MYFSKSPLLHSAINASTFGNTPFADLMRSLKKEEKNNPKILSTSFIHVDPYIDQEDMGGGALVITDNDLETAKKISSSVFTFTTNGSMTILEQAKAYNSFDILITPHGSQHFNAIWINHYPTASIEIGVNTIRPGQFFHG